MLEPPKPRPLGTLPAAKVEGPVLEQRTSARTVCAGTALGASTTITLPRDPTNRSATERSGTAYAARFLSRRATTRRRFRQIGQPTSTFARANGDMR